MSPITQTDGAQELASVLESELEALDATVRNRSREEQQGRLEQQIEVEGEEGLRRFLVLSLTTNVVGQQQAADLRVGVRAEDDDGVFYEPVAVLHDIDLNNLDEHVRLWTRTTIAQACGRVKQLSKQNIQPRKSTGRTPQEGGR